MATRKSNQRPAQPIRTPQDNIREYIRTDIRIHCDTEPTLKKTFESFDINSKEFKRLFAKRVSKSEQSKKKKGLFSRKKTEDNQDQNKEQIKRPSYYLKSLVAVHLNIIYNQAKTSDFLNEIQELNKEQSELKEFEQYQPELLHSFFNFEKQLTPSRALEFLQRLEKETMTIDEELQAIDSNHKHENSKLLKQFEATKKELDDDLKNMGIMLTEKQLNEFTKALGGITP